jgi:hypothetical protein
VLDNDLDHGTVSTSDTVRQRHERSALTDAVDFATGKIPGANQWHPLGVEKPRREVAALRKDTLRLEHVLRVALSVLPPPPLSQQQPPEGGNKNKNSSSSSSHNSLSGEDKASAEAAEGRRLQYESELLATEVNASEALAVRFPLAQRAVEDAQVLLERRRLHLKQQQQQQQNKGGRMNGSRSFRGEQEGENAGVVFAQGHEDEDQDDDGNDPNSMMLVAAELQGTLNKESWGALSGALARASYEQKQLDLAAGELAEQVRVWFSCSRYGLVVVAAFVFRAKPSTLE